LELIEKGLAECKEKSRLVEKFKSLKKKILDLEDKKFTGKIKFYN